MFLMNILDQCWSSGQWQPVPAHPWIGALSLLICTFPKSRIPESSDSQAIESELGTLGGNDVVELVDIFMWSQCSAATSWVGRDLWGNTTTRMPQCGSKLINITGRLLMVHTGGIPWAGFEQPSEGIVGSNGGLKRSGRSWGRYKKGRW